MYSNVPRCFRAEDEEREEEANIPGRLLRIKKSIVCQADGILGKLKQRSGAEIASPSIYIKCHECFVCFETGNHCRSVIGGTVISLDLIDLVDLIDFYYLRYCTVDFTNSKGFRGTKMSDPRF